VRHFGGLRIALDGLPPALNGPTVFYANHPSWWDPIVLLIVIRSCYPAWRFHGPIDDRALQRYPWLERFGLFGIEPGSVAGTRRFLQIGTTLLARPLTGVAITAQGEFTDVRKRPLELKRGLTRLLEQNPSAVAIPVALEYPFWDERLPEALVRFGTHRIAAPEHTRDSLHAALETGLEATIDDLAATSLARDPDDFTCLLQGRRGVGLLQDLPHRLRALLKGQAFDPAHSAIAARRANGR
jgi:hypothetical protein